MKTLTLLKNLTLLLLITATIFSCSSNDPKTVAQKYLNAIAENKIDEASTYATKAMQEELVKNANEDDLKNDSSNVKHTVLSAIVKGDIASVESKISCNCMVNDQKLTLRMVKQNGHWLVSEIKSDSTEPFTADQLLKIDTDALTASVKTYDDTKLSAKLKTQKQEILDSLSAIQKEIAPGSALEKVLNLQERTENVRQKFSMFVVVAAMPQ